MYLKNFAVTDLAVCLFDLDYFVVLDAFDVLDHHQRSYDLFNCAIFLAHIASLFVVADHFAELFLEPAVNL